MLTLSVLCIAVTLSTTIDFCRVLHSLLLPFLFIRLILLSSTPFLLLVFLLIRANIFVIFMLLLVFVTLFVLLVSKTEQENGCKVTQMDSLETQFRWFVSQRKNNKKKSFLRHLIHTFYVV